MNAPQVSVIIDTYNYGRFIEDAIDSVLSQNFPQDEMEVLVVDDGSTDATAERVRKYGTRVQYLYKANGGQASAFNYGFAMARGEMICLLDGDDYWLPGKLRRVVEAFAAGCAGMVSTGYQLSTSDPSGRIPASLPAVSGDIPADIKKLLEYRVFPTSCLSFRRAALMRLLPVPEKIKLQADVYLALLVIFVAPVVALPEKLTTYRIHDRNLYSMTAKQASSEIQRQQCTMMRTILEEIQLWFKNNRFNTRDKHIRIFLDQWIIFEQAAKYRVDPPTRFELLSHLLRFNRTYRHQHNRKLTLLNYLSAMRILLCGYKQAKIE